MKVIAKPRQTGKTTDLLKLAEKNFSYIVCPTILEANSLYAYACDQKINIPQPISWYEFLEKKYYQHGIKGGFMIDNLDMCIQSMSPVEIKAVTLNKDSEL